MKICNVCHVEKPHDQFWKRAASKDGYQHACIPCKNAWEDANREKRRQWARSRYKDNPDRGKEARARHKAKNPAGFRMKDRMSKYGSTEQDYWDMYEDQEGRCAWCGESEENLDKTLAVDHCHETGAVRRLLCNRCNWAEGHLKHFPEALLAVEALAWYNPIRNVSD